MAVDPFVATAAPLVMGVLLGGLYAVIGIGLSLIFGVMRLINIAHGDFVIFGSYFSYVILIWFGLDPFISLLAGLPVLFGIGFAFQRYAMSRVFKLGMEPPLIIAFGTSIILQNVYQMLFTPMSRGLVTSYALQSFEIGGIHLPLVYLLDFAGGLGVMVFLALFLKKTYMGLAIRSSSQNWKSAQLMGINTERIYSYTFGISLALAAIAGVLVGITFPFIPTSGLIYLVIAFGIIVLGGLGSITGTFIGGIIIGIVQTLSGHYFGVGWQMFFGYLVILIILAIRPQGIFARK